MFDVSAQVASCLRTSRPSSTAACSSSLVSLHMAFNSILAEQSSMAVNSGVNLMLTPDTPAMFQASRVLQVCYCRSISCLSLSMAAPAAAILLPIECSVRA